MYVTTPAISMSLSVSINGGMPNGLGLATEVGEKPPYISLSTKLFMLTILRARLPASAG